MSTVPISRTSEAFRDQARQRKADALLAVFRKYGYTVEHVERMTKNDWAVASKAAGVVPPSDATKELIVGQMAPQRPQTDGEKIVLFLTFLTEYRFTIAKFMALTEEAFMMVAQAAGVKIPFTHLKDRVLFEMNEQGYKEN